MLSLDTFNAELPAMIDRLEAIELPEKIYPYLFGHHKYPDQEWPQTHTFCPFCRKDHYHGTVAGHRVAHCISEMSPFQSRGYTLVHLNRTDYRHYRQIYHGLLTRKSKDEHLRRFNAVIALLSATEDLAAHMGTEDFHEYAETNKNFAAQIIQKGA